MKKRQNKKIVIGVIGGHRCSAKVEQIAYKIGKNIAKMEASLVSGGLSGVMKAVSKGAKEAGGTTLGILPGENKKNANAYIDIAIPTGLGLARNTLVVRTADIIIALPGAEGTLSEIAFALILKKKIINLSNWDVPGTIKAKNVDDVVNLISRLVK